jgi:hypothetical protein
VNRHLEYERSFDEWRLEPARLHHLFPPL